MSSVITKSINILPNGDDYQFSIKHPFSLIGPVSIITGKNGVGKTRMLRYIERRVSSAVAEFDVNTVAQYLDFSSFDASISLMGGGLLVKPIDVSKEYEVYRRMSEDGYLGEDTERQFLDYESMPQYDCPQGDITFREEIKEIAKKTGKDIHSLSIPDFYVFAKSPENEVFSINELFSGMANYAKLKKDVLFSKWLLECGCPNDRKIMSEDELKELYPIEPWDVVNKILYELFDGKFEVKIPFNIFEGAFTFELIEVDAERVVELSNLSAGEKSLLGLSAAMFNYSSKFQMDSLKKVNLFLLDEPDMRLHPQMVSKMLKVLKSISETLDCFIIITTHSPTTVALCDENCIYTAKKEGLVKSTRDEAINELMDGVTAITVSAENRKHVYVESVYDHVIYQEVYEFLRSQESIAAHPYLSFVSSGAKVEDETLSNCLVKYFDVDKDSQEVRDFIKHVNGVGACSHVYAQVKSLTNRGAKNIHGMVDWDAGNNTNRDGVIVFADGVSYAIENIILDPISVMLLLNSLNRNSYPLLDEKGKDLRPQQWIVNVALLQKCIDDFTLKVLGEENNADTEIEYINSMRLKHSSKYLHRNGHNLEALIAEKYPPLNQFVKKGEGRLKKRLINANIDISNGGLISKCFLDAFNNILAL